MRIRKTCPKSIFLLRAGSTLVLMMIFSTKKRYEDFYYCGALKNIFNIDKGLNILGPGLFRPGLPRILRTLELVHRISSVSRGLAPFPLDVDILNRPFKRRSGTVGARNVVLNDNRNP